MVLVEVQVLCRLLKINLIFTHRCNCTHSPISTEALDRSESIFLKYVHEPHSTNGVANDIFYECRDINQGSVYLGFAFNNNSNGDYDQLYSSVAHFQDIPSATNSLKWFVENNRAIYYGGSSSSNGSSSQIRVKLMVNIPKKNFSKNQGN